LIRRGKWPEAIALLESRVVNSEVIAPFSDRFHLAMAYWGSGKEPKAKELCRALKEFLVAKGSLEEVLSEPFRLHLSLAQQMFLIFWLADEHNLASQVLACLGDFQLPAEVDGLFSFWRYKDVRAELFNEDLTSQKRMLMGSPIRPPFLGVAATSS
jgi:hypothetical protein